MLCRKAEIEAQIERAQKRARTEADAAEATQGSELHRHENEEPLKIALSTAAPERASGKPPIAPKLNAAFADDSRWVCLCLHVLSVSHWAVMRIL